MNDTRFLKIVIVILLLINIGSISFMWLHHPPPPPMHERDALHFMIHELKLSDAEQTQFETLKKDHQQAMENFKRTERNLHDKYFGLLSTASDSMSVTQMADSISNNQKQIELLTFYHFKKVRAILTSEQQKKFDEMIGNALGKMASPPPPHGR